MKKRTRSRSREEGGDGRGNKQNQDVPYIHGVTDVYITFSEQVKMNYKNKENCAAAHP